MTNIFSNTTVETAPPVIPPPPEIEVTFSVPDEWTMEHYTRYMDAKIAAKTGLEWIARYHGVVALVKSGFVQIRSNNEDARTRVLKLLQMEEKDWAANLSTKFMGFVVRHVALPLENSVYVDPNW